MPGQQFGEAIYRVLMCRDVNGVTTIPRRFSSASMSRPIRYHLVLHSRGTVHVLRRVPANRIASCVGGVVHGRVHGGVAGPGAMSTRLLLQFLCDIGTEVRDNGRVMPPGLCMLSHRGCRRRLPLVLSMVLGCCVSGSRGCTSSCLLHLRDRVGTNDCLTAC